MFGFFFFVVGFVFRRQDPREVIYRTELLLRDLHIIDTGLDEAGRVGIRGLDQQPHGLPREAVETRARSGPYRVDIRRGAELLEYYARVAAHHADTKKVRARRVRAVRQVVVERQCEITGGRQRDRRRTDQGHTAVDIVRARTRNTHETTRDEDKHPTNRGA